MRARLNSVLDFFIPCAILLVTSLAAPLRAEDRPAVIEPPADLDARAVPHERMQQVFDEVKTPFKYGIVAHPGPNESLDCPNVFRFGDKWYMVYVSIKNRVGYETYLAESTDLLHWKWQGKVLAFAKSGWDQWQADGSIALVDPTWGGSVELHQFDGKYWMSYFGGNKKGYETDPLSLGLAWTTTPDKPVEWHRLKENPVLGPNQSDARPFERATLYKSQILWDKSESLGYPFVMYYNGKQQGRGIERIGMAVSKDLVHWTRYGKEPVIDNGSGISGDPQIVRMGDLWVMFYFGAFWQPGAFDTFACSYDLVHWTKWDGPHLIESSEPWDKTFAHKPWIIKHDGVVYHFYCAVGSKGRAIALATSKDMREEEKERTWQEQ
jgi:(4-O-methyl)-D-glucuronate---lignin esterase